MAKLQILGVKKMSSYQTWLASLPSTLISKYQWGCPYVHVALVDSIVEGTPLVWEAVEQGVVYQAVTNRPWDLFEISTTERKVQLVKKWVGQQVGKNYDYFGLVGFLWRRDYQDDDKWFCSELIAEACRIAEIPVLNWNIVKSWQVTPRLRLAGCEGPIKFGGK